MHFKKVIYSLSNYHVITKTKFMDGRKTIDCKLSQIKKNNTSSLSKLMDNGQRTSITSKSQKMSITSTQVPNQLQIASNIYEDNLHF